MVRRRPNWFGVGFGGTGMLHRNGRRVLLLAPSLPRFLPWRQGSLMMAWINVGLDGVRVEGYITLLSYAFEICPVLGFTPSDLDEIDQA